MADDFIATTTKRDPARRRPRQLADCDSVFLSVECPQAASHIAGLTIVDPSTADPERFGFDRYREVLAERVALVDRFRWKLRDVPLGLDRAYWVEDEHFDLDQHVHRVAVPAPGDHVALAEIAAWIHAEPLDRARPLWESWWIEGLEGGRVASLLKFHHCLMDGQSGMELCALLMDVERDPDPATLSDRELREPPPRPPGLAEMTIGAIGHGLRRPERLWHHAGRALRSATSGFLASARTRDRAPRVPAAVFNGPLSPHRRFAFATLPLEPIREAKKRFDVKINDVLLEIVGASLRHALLQTDDLPEESIVALCPVSLRRENDASLGNQISSMPVSLATHLPDPVARLYAIRESSLSAKRRLIDGAFETLSALGESLLPGVLGRLTRAAHVFPASLPLPGNLVVSNVRGLPVPTYLAGARVEQILPLSMLQVANGLNVTAVSHDDQVDIGFLADARLVADAWLYAEGATRALEELSAAVAARSRALEGPRNAPPAFEKPAEFDEPPIDLSILMSGLVHVRAPSREPIGRPAPEGPTS